MSGFPEQRKVKKTYTSPPDVFEPDLKDYPQKLSALKNSLSSFSSQLSINPKDFKDFHPISNSDISSNSSSSSPTAIQKDNAFQPDSGDASPSLEIADQKPWKNETTNAEEIKSPSETAKIISPIQVPEQEVPTPKDTPFASTEHSPKEIREFNIPNSLHFHKFTYSCEEIQMVKYEDWSFVMPIEIVKIWRRKKTDNNWNSASKLPIPKPMIRASAPDSPGMWRAEMSETQLKIRNRAEKLRKKLASQTPIDEISARRIKTTLNKLTPTNLDKLKLQLFEISREKQENLELLVSGIFQKACTETKYTQLYAELCQYLSHQYHTLKSEDERKKKNNPFRDAFLSLCEALFFYNPGEENFEGLSKEDIDIKKYKLKQKVLGNVRLIGELFRFEFIPAKVVLQCIWDLTTSGIEKDGEEYKVNQELISEDKLEGAAILLNTGGSMFEIQKLIKQTEELLEIVQYLIDKELVSSRIRFLLMNVLDARKQGWPRPKEQPSFINQGKRD